MPPAIVRPAAVLLVTLLSLAARPVPQPPATLTPARVAGSRVATISHAGESRELELAFEPRTNAR